MGLLALVLRGQQTRLDTFDDAINAAATSFAVYDAHDRLVICNEGYKNILPVDTALFKPGMHYGNLMRSSLHALFPPEEAEAEIARRLALHRAADGTPSDRLYSNGRWLRVTKKRTPRGANVGVAIDVTEYYELKKARDAQNRRFLALAENAPAGICEIDDTGAVVFANAAMLAIAGAEDKDELLSAAGRFSCCARSADTFGGLVALLNSGTSGDVTIEMGDERRDFMVRNTFVSADAEGDADGAAAAASSSHILIFLDITERKKAEAEIRYLARYDPLTGAGNRVALQEDLPYAVASASRERQLSVIAIDLDRFKPVNDVYGHGVGDDLLAELAHRAAACLSGSMALYRLGGDEFAVLCCGAENAEVDQTAMEIVEALCRPYQFENYQVRVGASAGIATLPGDAQNVDALFHNADLALYDVKMLGGSGVRRFDRSIGVETYDRHRLQLDLAAALAGEEMDIAFQPIVAADGTPVALETLARWHNKRVDADVPPQRFIAIAEAANLIERLDAMVFDKALAQYAAWQADGVAPPMMFINMSARTLSGSSIAGRVAAALKRHGVAGNRVTIEMTESFAVESPEELAATIHRIHSLGVRFAIDDFGTGYTSMRLLADLPIAYLKIDRSFVTDLDGARSSTAVAIMRVMLEMAAHLKLDVIAEGVETCVQFQRLKDLGCTLFQGFLFARPEEAQTARPNVPERLAEG